MTAVAKEKQRASMNITGRVRVNVLHHEAILHKILRPWGWVIGSGMYLDDVNREIAKFRWIIIGTTLVLALLVLALSYLIANNIRKNLSKAVDASKSLSEGDLSIDIRR
jgi:methyl-accepting chemotaxis protein